MYKLNYSITEKDMKSVNDRIMIFYFSLYFAVAAVGIAVGIIAFLLSAQKLMFVLGIILTVLGGLLMLCALFMLFAPRNYVLCALPADGTEYSVTVDKAIIVECENKKVTIPFSEVTAVKKSKEYILVYIGKAHVLPVKDSLISGESFDRLYETLRTNKGRLTVDEVKEALGIDEGGEKDAPEEQPIQPDQGDEVGQDAPAEAEQNDGEKGPEDSADAHK